ncbi:transglutaminase-like domain-containing protein [Brevibacillus dissolubilis]|uniref:transglutaminase-like domain-containing protein n=1 Tax=Brevibacillus dissolubilis TaxID=1844116 RepID=UPI00159B8D73|nr:transglutaminase-like domain-containing protein [Brevibacillus dissolubilis]
MRQAAIDILLQAAVPAKAYLQEIETLFRWVQRKIRYTKDPYRLELLTSALRILQLRIGDCDDMTVLLGSMLESIGHPVRLVVAGYNRNNPNLFSHVYLEVYIRGHWIALDPTMSYPMGWQAPWVVRATMPIHNYDRVAPTLRGTIDHHRMRERSQSGWMLT